MSKQNNSNPLMGQPRKKHHLWGLWIPLIIIFTLVLLPVGVAAALFYDGSHLEVLSDEDRQQEKNGNMIFSSIMTNMFDGCRKEENPSIDLIITQKELNQVLYHATKSTVTDEASPLKQFACLIRDDGVYYFDLEISAYNIAKTHIGLEATVESNAELGAGKRGFEFQITNLKAGRLSGLQSVLPWLAETAGIDLSSIFSSAGLSIKADMDNLLLRYAYDDFVNDLTKMAGSADPLFINIFSNFFTKNLISFTHHDQADVTGSITMVPFTTNAGYSNDRFIINPMMGENNDTPMLTYYATQVQSIIEEQVNSNGSIADKAATLIKFLAYGDEFLSSDEDTFVTNLYPNIKATYCENKDKDKYSEDRKTAVFGNTSAGVMDRVTKKVNKIIKDWDDAKKLVFINKAINEGSAMLFDANDPLIVYDTDVWTMLKSNPHLIGYGFGFVGKDANNKTKVSYATLDNAYPTILPASNGEEYDTMALTFGLNINGCETSLIMPMKSKEIHDEGKHGLTFYIKDADLYFGTEVFPNLKDQIQDIMNDVSVGDDDDMIQFYKNPDTGNVEEIRMIFDFDDYFEDKRQYDPDDPFYKLNALAETKGAKLSFDIDFAKSGEYTDSNHPGQFNVKVGYVKKATA